MRELSARTRCDDTDHSLNDSAVSVTKFSEKTRLWALTYVCTVAVQAVILSGFALGFTSPVLSKLKDIRGGNRSLEKTVHQDIFNVRTLQSNFYIKSRAQITTEGAAETLSYIYYVW